MINTNDENNRESKVKLRRTVIYKWKLGTRNNESEMEK